MNSPDSPLLAGTSLKPSHRGKPQERSTTTVFVMATVNHMKISWYIFVLIYFLQQVQPQATESDTTSATVLSVTEEETTAAAKEDVKSQETPMTATAEQEKMETTAAEGGRAVFKKLKADASKNNQSAVSNNVKPPKQTQENENPVVSGSSVKGAVTPIIANKTYKIIQSKGRRTWKRRVEEKTYEVKFDQEKAGTKLIDILDNLINMFDDVIQLASSNYTPNDKAQLTITHEGMKDELFIHLQDLGNISGTSIMNRFSKASEPSGVTSDPARSTQLSEGNTTNGNSTLDGDSGTTVASHMSEGDNQTSQTPADLMGNNATTEGESAEMTTAAMPSTCYSCNDTDCNNSSNWQTCTTTGGCSITFLKESKTILLSCTKSCRGPFPNGQFTASECGFCCMGAYCNNYTAAAAETACINMAGSGTSGMEIYPAVFLLCAIVQMILIQK